MFNTSSNFRQSTRRTGDTHASSHSAGREQRPSCRSIGGPARSRPTSRSARATPRETDTLSSPPRWKKPHQREYGYSFREHAIVLTSLRDACQRLSIDTDRVFLSGHSMGGDAAWDLALAHPDLWAGVIPIVAGADKYVARLYENAKHVPLYFVEGDMDAQRPETNSREIDRYMLRNYDVTLVEYRGWGHGSFQDEILRIYDWMNLHKRNFFPTQFKMLSMRSWDNFFWCVELDGFPDRALTPPLAWPRPNVRPASTDVQVLPNNNVIVNSAAKSVRLFLTPDMVRFEKSSTIMLNGRRTTRGEPGLEGAAGRRPHSRRPPAPVLGHLLKLKPLDQ